MEIIAVLAGLFGLGLMWFLVLNSIVGLICLFLFNLVAGFFQWHIQIGCLNTLIVGIFGIPGLVVVVLWNLLFGTIRKEQANTTEFKE